MSPSSENDEFFEVFKCSGEIYQITCYAFQITEKKSVAPYPRFDNKKMSKVRAGFYDSTKVDSLRFTNFAEYTLEGASSLLPSLSATLAAALATYIAF